MSIKIENTQVYGWEAAIRGMRNPMNSWDKSDSWFYDYTDVEDMAICHSLSIQRAIMGDSDEEGCLDISWIERQESPEIARSIEHEVINDHPYDWLNPCNAFIGQKDHELMMKLAKNGSVHSKYRRMISVTVDITAPLFWWKEADTYKVGTVVNSCSTMHKIHSKEFTLDDFSWDNLQCDIDDFGGQVEIPTVDYIVNTETDEKVSFTPFSVATITLAMLNTLRNLYNETHRKIYWNQMIQLLPSSYNQRRTVQLNYEVLANIYIWRKDHKLLEWREFCDWIESLPYSEIITGIAPNISMKGEE